MKPTPQAKNWVDTKHCRRNAVRHGIYSAQLYSARALLRTLDELLTRLEVDADAETLVKSIAQSKAAPRESI